MIDMISIFEVWRPTGTDGCYSLVGSNFVDNGAPGNVHNVRCCTEMGLMNFTMA